MPDLMLEKAPRKGAYVAIRVYCPSGNPTIYNTVTSDIHKLFGIKAGDNIEMAGFIHPIHIVEMRFERWDNDIQQTKRT